MTRSIPGSSRRSENRSERQSSPNPTPPAAPAPGVSRSRRPVAVSSASAKRASRASRTGTASGAAPFCGPYTAAAPRSPRSGFVTSHAIRSVTSARRGSRPDTSTRARSSVIVAPRARSRPAAPSLVALPPIPSAMSRIPASSTARSTSPVPWLVARAASRSAASTRRQPGRGRHLHEGRPCRPRARATGRGSAGPAGRVPPRPATASRLTPRPPRASPPRRPRAVRARPRRRDGRGRHPAASARATSTLVSDPLNESGAIRTRTGGSGPLAGRGAPLLQVLGDADHRRPFVVGELMDLEREPPAT